MVTRLMLFLMQKLMSHPLDSGHQVHEENTCTKFHQNQALQSYGPDKICDRQTDGQTDGHCHQKQYVSPL